MTEKQGIIVAKKPWSGYVALGSNLETATQTSLDMVNGALGLFAEAGLRVRARSHWYRAPAFPAGAGPDYVNGVVEIETTQAAAVVLAALHNIEDHLGRTRPKRWASRVIDLDLLAIEAVVSPDLAEFYYWKNLSLSAQMEAAPKQLILPHPRLQDRAFVLQPLAEIAPHWRHPVLGQTATTLLAALPAKARAEIQPI